MSSSLKRSFWFNLLIILLLCAGLYVLFFASLSWITHHGEEVKMPNMSGKDARTAANELRSMGFDVEIDSAFRLKAKPYEVLTQMPEPGSVVKNSRTIYLTINKAEPPSTPLPNLINISYRSSVLILRNNHLAVGDTILRPDIANGAVLEMMFRGQAIRPGTMVPQGSRIDLVVGAGLSNEEIAVPDLIGLEYPIASAMAGGNRLLLTEIWDAGITDTNSARVYDQYPRPVNGLGMSNRINAGDNIDIYIKQNPRPGELDSNKRDAPPVNNPDPDNLFD
jgi:beta-lactam-binding protein with PASTA domain